VPARWYQGGIKKPSLRRGGIQFFKVSSAFKPNRESRRADSNRLPLLQLRVCGQAVQVVARDWNSPYLSRFLCRVLPSVAPYGVPPEYANITSEFGYARR
jgi:hypothetical protein